MLYLYSEVALERDRFFIGVKGQCRLNRLRQRLSEGTASGPPVLGLCQSHGLSIQQRRIVNLGIVSLTFQDVPLRERS